MHSTRHILLNRALAVAAVTMCSQVLPAESCAGIGEKVTIDTDIDDAFAVAPALRSSELKILGFSTASGDMSARVRILDQALGVEGHNSSPVGCGASDGAPARSLI